MITALKRNMLLKLAAALLLAPLSVVAGDKYEVVANLPAETPPGNIAISKEGRIFLTVHDFYPSEYRLVELMPDGSTRPYPNKNWAVKPSAESGAGIQNMLGVNTDGNGMLWGLDNAGPNHSGRLLGFDLSKDALSRVIYLSSPVTRDTSFLNDFAVDTKRNAIYITDTGAGESSALIVVDLNTGWSRRVLEGSAFTVSEDLDMNIDGRVVNLGDQPARIGANPITIDHNAEWVYFAPMTGKSFYRVRAAHLMDRTLSADDLVKSVERYGAKPLSDGSTIDNAGNVYITSITDASVGVTKPDGSYEQLFQHAELSWPDGFSNGADGYIYATINALHKSPVLGGTEKELDGLFKIIRFKPLAAISVGR